MIFSSFSIRSLFLCFALFLVACGGDVGDSGSAAATSTIIGPAGGTLVGPDGSQLVVPAGALSEPTTLKITKTSIGAPVDPPGDTNFSGTIYEFTPHGLTFLEPVTLTIPAGSAPAGATTGVYTSSPGDSGWRLMQSTTEDGKSSWQTYAFSWYTPAVCSLRDGEDIKSCIQASLDGQLTANPSDAVSVLSSSLNHKAWRITKAAAMRLAFEMSAPSDCGNGRLLVKRRAVAGQTEATLLDESIALVVDPANANVARQVLDWDFSLTSADNGRYIYDLRFTCARPSGATRSAGGYGDLRVEIPSQQAPSITGQPANVTVTEPASATFTAAAAGDPTPTLQWQRSSDGVNWGDISGANSNSYTMATTSASADNGARFRAVATNGTGSATSNVAQLTVLVPVTGSWRAVENIETTLMNAEPSVGFDSTGRAIAVWRVTPDTGPTRIYGATRSGAGVWTTPALVDSGFTSGYAPRIAVAPDGRAVMAFERGNAVYAARFDGSAWSAPARLDVGFTLAVNLSVAIDNSGRAIVAWYGYDGTRYRALASVSASGNTWAAPQVLDAYDAGTPQVAVNGNGQGFVVFTERDASEPQKYRVTAVPVDLAATVAYGIAQPLRTFVTSSPGQMRIAVDGSGNAIAVWLDTDGVAGDLVWSRYDAVGGAWSAHQLLAQGVGTQVDGYARSYNLGLAMNAGGDAVVAWGQHGVTDGSVSDQAIFTRRLPAGDSTWTTAERRSSNTPNTRDYAENPRLALSAGGRIAVTWIQEGTTGYKVWGQVFEGGIWQPAQAIMTSANDIDVDAEYALAMDGSGMPLAVWAEWPSAMYPLVGAVWR